MILVDLMMIWVDLMVILMHFLGDFGSFDCRSGGLFLGEALPIFIGRVEQMKQWVFCYIATENDPLESS